MSKELQFKFFYFMVGCFNSGEINGTGGIIKTPNYPSYYPGNTRCAWKIRVPDGSSESALKIIRMCTNSDNLFYSSGRSHVRGFPVKHTES